MTVNKKTPQRLCVGCGENKDKKNLIRVLKTGENEFILDDTGKKNGRGAYICKNVACMEKAIKTKGLDRSFKMAIPQSVYDQLMEEMKQYEE